MSAIEKFVDIRDIDSDLFDDVSGGGVKLKGFFPCPSGAYLVLYMEEIDSFIVIYVTRESGSSSADSLQYSSSLLAINAAKCYASSPGRMYDFSLDVDEQVE